jgi:hypothetical protein
MIKPDPDIQKDPEMPARYTACAQGLFCPFSASSGLVGLVL